MVVVKKVQKFDNLDEKSKQNLFFIEKRGVFDRKLHEESKKNSPNALQLLLFEKIGL